MKVTIGSQDAVEMGVPTSVEFDMDAVRMKVVRALRLETGHTMETLGAALRGGDTEAMGIMAWLAYWAAGHQIAFGDWDVILTGIEVDKGKAETSDTQTGVSTNS